MMMMMMMTTTAMEMRKERESRRWELRDMRTDLVSTPAAGRNGEVEASRFVEAAAIRHAVHQDDRVTPLDVLLQLAVLVLFTATNFHHYHHHHRRRRRCRQHYYDYSHPLMCCFNLVFLYCSP